MGKSNPPTERRGTVRRQLRTYLRVFESGGTILYGHVVNIAPGGLMLVMSKPATPGTTVRMRISLPYEVGGASEMKIEALCRWCRPDVNPNFYVAGFVDTKPLPATVKHIEVVMAELGLTEPRNETTGACS
jgi:hypothetical protein